MTPEEKELLLKDLCTRLRSGLICKVSHKDFEGWKEEDMVLSGIIDDEGYFTNEKGSVYSCEFKPYLRPMSSVTEEERNNLRAYCRTQEGIIYDIGVSGAINSSAIIDWLNKNHFDYRGLIPMGLALEAPEGMYN